MDRLKTTTTMCDLSSMKQTCCIIRNLNIGGNVTPYSNASDHLSHFQFVEPSKLSAVSQFLAPQQPPISVLCSFISNVLKRKLS